MRDILVAQNPHWHNQRYPEGVGRDIFPGFLAALQERFVKAIIGPRRAGKSFLAKQTINHLLATVDAKSILYVNFEDPALIALREDPEGIRRIFEQYLQLTAPEGRLYLFLDEIQNMRGWQHWVRATYDEGRDVQLVVTGSNSQLLSGELATHLTGRVLTFTILPFSFKEYLALRGVALPGEEAGLVAARLDLLRHLGGYLVVGGFPEILQLREETLRAQALKEYFNGVIAKDLVPRFGIRDTHLLERVAHYLFTNVAKPFSYNGLAKAVGSNENTVREYLSYCDRAFLLFEVEHFSYSARSQAHLNKKSYAIDNGLRNAVALRFSPDEGWLAENMVFVELLRRGRKPRWWRGNHEVDFVVGEQEPLAINVTHGAAVDERELLGLKEFKRKHGKAKLLLLTRDEEGEREGVTMTPMWKWLLET